MSLSAANPDRASAKNPYLASPGAVLGFSYVEWGAVWAGAVMAAALSFVLLAFGGAVGLSVAPPWSQASAPAITTAGLIGSIAVFWTMAAQIAACMAGGYVAGRMRTRFDDATEHEVEFRDGLHGGLVWAMGVIISAFLVVSVASTVTRAGANAASQVATSAANNTTPLDYSVDLLLRPNLPPATNAAVPATTAAGTETRAEAVRVFGMSLARGTLSDQDRTFLASLVAQRTGLSEADAEKRVTDTFTEAVQTAKDTASKIKSASILFGLVTAVGLMIALAAAWWSAQRGGYHRDNGIAASFLPHRSS